MFYGTWFKKMFKGFGEEEVFGKGEVFGGPKQEQSGCELRLKGNDEDGGEEELADELGGHEVDEGGPGVEDEEVHGSVKSSSEVVDGQGKGVGEEGRVCCCGKDMGVTMGDILREHEERLGCLVEGKMDRYLGEVVEVLVGRVKGLILSETRSGMERQRREQGEMFGEVLEEMKGELVQGLDRMKEMADETWGVSVSGAKDRGDGERCRYGEWCVKHGRVHRSREELGRSRRVR